MRTKGVVRSISHELFHISMGERLVSLTETEYERRTYMFKDPTRVDPADVEYVIKRVRSMTGKETGTKERAFAEHLIRDAQQLAPIFMEIASNTALLKIAESVAVTVEGASERAYNPDEVAFDLAGEFLARECQAKEAGHTTRWGRRFRQVVFSKIKR